MFGIRKIIAVEDKKKKNEGFVLMKTTYFFTYACRQLTNCLIIWWRTLMLNGLIQKILKNEVQLKIKKTQKKTLNDDDTQTLMALFFHQLSRNFLEFLWILQSSIILNLEITYYCTIYKVHLTKCILQSAIYIVLFQRRRSRLMY